jgi:hypothetical protein
MGVSVGRFTDKRPGFLLARLASRVGVISLWNYCLVVVFQDVPLKE